MESLSPLGVKLITSLAGIVGFLLVMMHSQAMKKLDKLIDSVSGLTNQIAKHDLKLETGESEFTKIEAHQKEQDAKIQNLDTRITIIESKE